VKVRILKTNKLLLKY